jgi:hypothetical protein
MVARIEAKRCRKIATGTVATDCDFAQVQAKAVFE